MKTTGKAESMKKSRQKFGGFIFSLYLCTRNQEDCTKEHNDGALAQLVEHRTENPCVPGSIPGGATSSFHYEPRESRKTVAGFFVCLGVNRKAVAGLRACQREPRRASTMRAIWLGMRICCGHLERHSSQS